MLALLETGRSGVTGKCAGSTEIQQSARKVVAGPTQHTACQLLRHRQAAHRCTCTYPDMMYELESNSLGNPSRL